MADSESLRRSKNQHRPKNTGSKDDDKAVYAAMSACIEYPEYRFSDIMEGYYFDFQKEISFETLISFPQKAGLRKEFDRTFGNRTIKPDGGIIFLKRHDDPDYLRIILISEVKRQGTNKQRMAEGKPKQARGNAIERLGKNLAGVRAALNHEPITPFVYFGSGCDFVEDYDRDAFVMSKVSMMNEFYPLNKTFVFKKDGSSDKNFYAPVSMYFREDEWTAQEMFDILKEVGETALRYYIF